MKKGCAKLLVSLLAVSVVFINAAVAISDRKDVDVEFVVDPSLTLSLSSDDVLIDNLIAGMADVSNEITVLVSTNSESGYILNATAGDITNNTTSLLHVDSGITDIFESIAYGTSVSSITESGTWGFSIDHGSTYSGMPLFTDTEHVEQIKATTEPALDEIPFSISARATQFQAPGEYRNIVTFVAIANPVPDTIETVRYMQDINDDVYASMEMEKQYQLIDKRDNKKYWIAKLADGNIWMTQNLDYRLTAPSITLYPETSNVTAATTIKIAENRPNQISYEDGTKNEGLLMSNVNPDTYIPGGDFVTDDGVFISHAALVSTESLASDDVNWHYQVGTRYPADSSYYNSNVINNTTDDYWYGGEPISNFSGDNIGALEGFCPKGWRLPESVPIDDIDMSAQYSVEALSKYYSQPNQSPVYLTGEIGEAYNGVGSNVSGVLVAYYLLTKDSRNNTVGSSYLSATDGSFWNDSDMDDFVPIRCIASRSTEYPFRYFANDGTGRLIYSYTPASWGGADASIKAINNAVKLYNADNGQEQEQEVIRLNYDFVGWATDPDATNPDYLPGDTVITNMSTTNDLYAIWQPTTKTTIEDAFAAAGKTKVDGEHYAMQDMTVSICIAADNGTGASLVDTRDGSIYTVMKMRRASEGSDGLCWMVDNLRLGDVDQDYVLTSDDSDIANEFTLPARSTYELSTSTAQMYVDDTMDEAIGKYYGNRYNRYAVTAGTNDLNGNSSICPKGWTIPQASNNNKGYAMTMLYYRGNGNSYGAVTNDILRQLRDPVAFSYTGAFDGSAFNDRTVGYYWTQQYNGGYYIYRPAIDRTLYGSSFEYTDSSAVETGFAALRCVIKTTL